MGKQRPIASSEEFGAVDAGTQPVVALIVALLEILEVVGERGVESRFEHLLVDGDPLLRRQVLIEVDLLHLPRLTELGMRGRISGGLDGGHGHGMVLDVVGMRISAQLVIGGHHLRPEGADDVHEGQHRDLIGDPIEATGRCLVVEITVGQPRVDVPDPDMFGAESGGGRRHLLTTETGDIAAGLRALQQSGVEDVAGFTTGHRGDEHPGTQRRVLRGRCRTLGGFVVGVGMDGQQAQPMVRKRSHILNVPFDSAWWPPPAGAAADMIAGRGSTTLD